MGLRVPAPRPAHIKKHGLSNPVILWRDDDVGGELSLLDGRNRLDAMEKVGIQFYSTLKEIRTPNGNTLSKTLPGPPGLYALKTNPYAFVLSANINRRHLTAEQKRDLIAKVLKATPEKSNRQIASVVKADDKTVAKVRTELEATADIPQLTKTTGADGKARKQRKRPSPEEVHERTKRRTEKKAAAIKATLNGQAVKTSDLGPAAQEQLTALLEATKPELEAADQPKADADVSTEARKALYAADEGAPAEAPAEDIVPNPAWEGPEEHPDNPTKPSWYESHEYRYGTPTESNKALTEWAKACDQWLPLMDDTDRKKARIYHLETWPAKYKRAQRKAAA